MLWITKISGICLQSWTKIIFVILDVQHDLRESASSLNPGQVSETVFRSSQAALCWTRGPCFRRCQSGQDLCSVFQVSRVIKHIRGVPHDDENWGIVDNLMKRIFSENISSRFCQLFTDLWVSQSHVSSSHLPTLYGWTSGWSWSQ